MDDREQLREKLREEAELLAKVFRECIFSDTAEVDSSDIASLEKFMEIREVTKILETTDLNDMSSDFLKKAIETCAIIRSGFYPKGKPK